ncbi:Uncharacterised protein [Rodentibacter pneumotropicus]|uniref:Uncharacterized protein n=1 Tax=Rodentibacter pneumotropicus TaxID=758 RepID=A0A3S4XUR2_9PAST|nr:Uncharacterised protein [Rodentibacter pneumotropicus]
MTAKANGTSEQQGGSLLTATAGADTAKRAVENNYLYNVEVDNLIKELAQAEKEGKDTKPIFEKYAKLSEKNRQELLQECGNNPVCYMPHIQMMKTGDEAVYENFSYLRLGSYFNDVSRATQAKMSDFVEAENAKTRAQLPNSIQYATLALGLGEAMGLGGIALKDKLPKLSFSSKDKNYPKGGMDNYQREKVGDSDYPSRAENNATAIPLKQQLSNEMLKAQGVKFENIDVIAKVDINGKIYVDTNQRARADKFADPNKPTLIAENISQKPPLPNGKPYPNSNMEILMQKLVQSNKLMREVVQRAKIWSFKFKVRMFVRTAVKI